MTVLNPRTTLAKEKTKEFSFQSWHVLIGKFQVKMKPVAKEMKEDLLVKTAEPQYHSITFPFKLAVSVPKTRQYSLKWDMTTLCHK